MEPVSCECNGFHSECKNTSCDCSLHRFDKQLEKKTEQKDLCFNCKLDYRYYNTLDNLLKEGYNEQYLYQISMIIERLRRCDCH